MGWFRRFKRARWGWHVLAGAAALAVVNVVVVAVVAAFYVDFVHEHGPGKSGIPRQSEPDQPVRSELAQRFAPILRLDSKELFAPIPRESYIGLTELREQEGKFDKLKDASPTVDSLPTTEGTCLRTRGCLSFLNVRAVEPDPPKHSEGAYGALERQLVRNGVKPVVYTHVTYYDDSGEYAVQYWFLYLFNYRLNEHEADWEQITLRLDSDKNPVDAYYSAHEGGNNLAWASIEKDGDHPVDYPARGSHANYFKLGRHPVTLGCKRVIGSIQQCFRGRKFLVDIADGRGTRAGPSDYTLTELGGPVFIGSYGSGNYVVLTRRPDVLSDPRARGAWTDPLRPLR